MKKHLTLICLSFLFAVVATATPKNPFPSTRAEKAGVEWLHSMKTIQNEMIAIGSVEIQKMINSHSSVPASLQHKYAIEQKAYAKMIKLGGEMTSEKLQYLKGPVCQGICDAIEEWCINAPSCWGDMYCFFRCVDSYNQCVARCNSQQ